ERLAGADSDRIDGDASELIEPDVRRRHVGAGPSRVPRDSMGAGHGPRPPAIAWCRPAASTIGLTFCMPSVNRITRRLAASAARSRSDSIERCRPPPMAVALPGVWLFTFVMMSPAASLSSGSVSAPKAYWSAYVRKEVGPD